MPVVTAADLKRFAPRATPRVAAAFVAHGDAAFARWGITSAPRLRMFMAQAFVESAGLTVVFENMDYSAKRLHAVWPNRFPSVASAVPYAHNPKALANKVYGGRMGNTGPHDGWLCRGQGLMQTTGRTNLTALAEHMGLSVGDTRAGLTSDEGMVACAAATFAMLGGPAFADKADLIGCTRRINNGLNGLTDRRTALERAAAVWPTMRAPAAVASPSPVPPVAAAQPRPPEAPPTAATLPPPAVTPWWLAWFRGVLAA